MSARRRRRWYLMILAAACAGVLALAISASRDGMTYYRTPSEARAEQSSGDTTMRLGGLVLPGSLEQRDDVSTLQLSDGATDITVAYSGRMPALVQEGEGAVVHGFFDGAGVFQAEEILLRHSNEYRAPDQAQEAPG